MKKRSSFNHFDSDGRGWDEEARGDARSCIDPILGVNLERDLFIDSRLKGKSPNMQGRSTMEHV